MVESSPAVGQDLKVSLGTCSVGWKCSAQKKNIILMELCERCGTSQTNSPSGSKASSRILKSSLVFQTFLGSVASKKPVQGVSIQSMMLSFVIFFASSKCLFSVSVYSFSQTLISASLTRPSCISRSLYTRSTSWEKEREKKIVKSFRSPCEFL